jgi:fructose-bisphosphate aldolase class I
MDSLVSDKYTADFLWDEKGIVPFLKVDKGLADQEDGVQVMKPIPGLNGLLTRALDRNVFGTKMRSVIKELSETGIDRIVNQQFETGIQIAIHGLVPILEPEVDIHCPDKAECEQILLEKILSGLEQLEVAVPVLFKLTILDNPKVARVVALSGGYSRDEATAKLSQNRNLIASFSRALIEGLNVHQTDKEFNSVLERSIEEIYEASST